MGNSRPAACKSVALHGAVDGGQSLQDRKHSNGSATAPARRQHLFESYNGVLPKIVESDCFSCLTIHSIPSHIDLGEQAMSSALLARFGAPLVIGLHLVGCDSIRGSQEPVTTSADLVNFAPGCMSDAVVLREYYLESWGGVPAPGSTVRTTVTTASGVTVTETTVPNTGGPTLPGTCPRGSSSRDNYRDMVIAYRLTVTNHRFREFSSELREAKVGIGLGAEILDAILDFAGAVFGGAATKSILSAASGAANAGRNSVDVNVFYKQALPAIVAKMEANRDAAIRSIREKQINRDASYPLDAALDDLARVERSSSIERAIADLTEDAKRQAKDAERRLETVYTDAQAKFVTNAESVSRRQKLYAKIDALDGPLLFALLTKEHATEQKNLKEIAAQEDPTSTKRQSDVATARKILKRWVYSTASEKDLSYWEATLN